jgi:serine/threonine-protein kinase
VLDVGLAKAIEGEVASSDVSQSPTLSVAMTRVGVILGTAAYMAPEQAKGKEVDKRADIWAFGCVLYEMLTGLPAFAGNDVSEVLASVIKGTTNFDLIPADLHPRLRELLARCLEKDVRKRMRDIGDVAYELECIHTDPHGSLSPPAAAARYVPSMRALLAGTVVGTALVTGSAVWILKPSPAVEPPHTARFTITLPEGQALRATGRPTIAIAPDGRYFVYNTTSGVYVRTMDGLNARLVPGTAEQNVTNLFVSPDGQWIGFWANNH